MRFRIATATSLFLILGFVFLGPLLVFWTAGYRWNPRNQRFEATGILTVDTIPTGAQIRIGETTAAATTPARLTGVFPREYTLTLSRDGYMPWQQTVSVSGGKTTFVDNIHLFPKQDPTRFFDQPTERLALSHDNTLLAAAVPKDGFTEIWLIGAESGNKSLEARLASSTVSSLQWSPSGNILLVTEKLPSGIRATLVQPGKKTALEIPNALLTAVSWSQDDATKLLGIATTLVHTTTTPPSLWLFPTSGATPTPLASAPSSTQDLPLLRDSILYGTRQDATTTHLFAFSPPTGIQTDLALLPGGPYDLLPAPQGFYTAYNSTRGTITVGEEQSPHTPTQVSGTDAAWSPTTPHAVLAWDDVELHLLEMDGRLATLARVAEGIHGATWTSDGTHALLLTAGDLRAIERAERFGKHISTILAPFEKTTALVTSPTATFVAGTRNGEAGIYRVPLE